MALTNLRHKQSAFVGCRDIQLDEQASSASGIQEPVRFKYLYLFPFFPSFPLHPILVSIRYIQTVRLRFSTHTLFWNFLLSLFASSLQSITMVNRVLLLVSAVLAATAQAAPRPMPQGVTALIEPLTLTPPSCKATGCRTYGLAISSVAGNLPL